MKIVIIGTGHVATVLGRKLKTAGHCIEQVYGRNKDAGIQLANELKAAACHDWSAIQKDAELYIVALSDKVLPEIDQHLHLTDQLAVHTAGAVSMSVLKNVSSNYGVFYPFQTIRKEVVPVPEIPLFIDASNEISKQQLMNLGAGISSMVNEAGDTARARYHLCAIMVNNFSNYLYAEAENYCNAYHLDFKTLLPLIEETAHRLRRYSPKQVQTGPATRDDIATIQKHLDLLNEDQRLKDLYLLLTENILHFNWQQE